MHQLFENRFGAAVLWIAIVAASIVPLVSHPVKVSRVVADPVWPTHIDGRPVRELPLTNVEARFEEDFPGRIKRFTDGRRILMVRWVTRPTRKLHPASDCFRGLGYEVMPRGVVTDEAGLRWGCFSAARNGTTLRVTERIWDVAGNSWTDVQAWFWAAALGRTSGPWWALTAVH